ncbi:hypothetical protein DRW03_14745 [Corallococcus sp. H22C18031201]|nr:hypothetical protein DRW03_14745 [Corallococcus sp. H22C18031201]
MRTLRAALVVSFLGTLAACSDSPGAPSDPPDSGVVRSGDVAPPDRTSCTGLTQGPGTIESTVQSGGRTRSYTVHVPPGYDATRPTPVIFAFHGFTSNRTEMEQLTQLSALGDTEGFITVYPMGLDALDVFGVSGVDAGTTSWNAGGACCGPAQIANVDDVGFVDAMLADLDTKVCVDPRRTFATGFSNGAFFAYRLACERAQRFAAIAPVSGMLGVMPCAPSRPVPVLHFHGTADATIAFDGGTVAFATAPYPSAPDSVRTFAERNGCKGPLQQTYSKGDSTCEAYTGCTPDSATASLCTIQGGQHAWPGQPLYNNGTRNLDASRELWRFFQARPRP